MKIAKRVLLVLALLLVPGLAAAGTITEYTLDDCDDQGCDGASLKITIDDLGNDMFLVDYTVTTDGTQSSDGLNQIGFLAITGWDDVELTAAPNGLSEWSDPVSAPTNANSTCSNVKATNTKVCIYGFVDTTNPDDYTWSFKFSGGSIVAEEDIHFGGQWADGPAPTAGTIISAGLPGETIPEPSAALVFAIGAVIVGSRVKRR